MKEPIMFKNNTTGERKAVYGLKDFIDIYMDNVNAIEDSCNKSFTETNGRITILERELKRTKARNAIGFIALAAIGIWNFKKITDLELKVDKLDETGDDHDPFDLGDDEDI